jgi:hypothetical protein
MPSPSLAKIARQYAAFGQNAIGAERRDIRAFHSRRAQAVTVGHDSEQATESITGRCQMIGALKLWKILAQKKTIDPKHVWKLKKQNVRRFVSRFLTIAHSVQQQIRGSNGAIM